MNTLVTQSDDLSTLLKASIQLQEVKTTIAKVDAQLAMLHNALSESLDLFEKRFDSDPSQFAPGEFEWYTHAAITMGQLYGRPHIAEKVAEAKFNSIMGM